MKIFLDLKGIKNFVYYLFFFKSYEGMFLSKIN